LKKNVIVVVNPISGALDKTELIEATSFFAKKLKLNPVTYSTTGQDDIAKIRALYSIHNPSRIIIIGGDGTIKLVAEALENEDVILGIIPAGSSNGLVVDLDMMLTLEENLKIAFHNKYEEIDLITINGRISIHLSDIGLNAKLIKNYEKSTVHGKMGYALQVFNTLVDLDEPFTATITANNQKTTCEASMIVIANSKKYGTGVVINPNGYMNDGKFELVILKNLDLLVFGKIISGNIPLDTDDVEIISTDNANIRINSPVSFQMDGEYCGDESEFDIKILHKQIKIAIP
jgi:YegS/Rv2252/BmrU family lipid kinase